MDAGTMFLLALLLTLHQVSSFNVDDLHPKIFKGPDRSYFGYSLAYYTSGNNSVLIVGAPRGNSSFFPGVREPGAVHRCSPSTGSCSEWLVDTSNGKKPAGLPGYEHQVKDGGWLGASIELHLDSTEPRVAICAPRWKKEMRIESRRTFMNGMCFSRRISQNGASRRYFPFSRTQSQIVRINGDNHYDHGMAEAGFSLHWPKGNRERFVVGAPGAAIWTGSSVLLTDRRSDGNADTMEALIPDVLRDPRFARNDYFGYSITSGEFHERNKLEYAAGAPRAADTRGKVFVYEFPDYGNAQLLVKRVFEGEQYGEYFGAALAACDLNADGRDDLLVGAPFWSKVSDEGRVYAYISERYEGNFELYRLSGELEQVGARFGSTISCLGDLDNDEYADLAVAAPYEDDGRGSIYIFSGGRSFDERYSQRIRAAKLRSVGLRGFGQSIGRDLEGNVAVGAGLSDHVVLFSTRPLIAFVLMLKIPDKFSLWTNQTELPLEVCALYRGRSDNAPKVINVNFTVQVDKFHHRTIIYDKVAFGDTYRFVDTLVEMKYKCIPIKTIHFKKNLQNVIDPIDVKAEVNLTDSTCLNCPIFDPRVSRTVDELKLAFLLDCQEDPVCASDLRVVNVTSPDITEGRFVVGSKPSVNISIAIENNGESAYRAQAHVRIPKPVGFARIPPECDEKTQVTNKTLELVCTIGNPLRDNYTLILELDMNAVVYTNKTQEIQVELTTQSKEKKPADNIGTLFLNYDVDADIAVVGKSYEESYAVYFEQENKSRISFDHVYEIQKFGSTPIEEACVYINVPTLWNSSEIARIRYVQGYMEGRTFDCENIDEEDSFTFPVARDGNNYTNARTYYVNCTNQAEVTCQTFLCVLGPLVKKNSLTKLTVTVDLQVSKDTAEAMREKDVLLFASEAFVRITQPNITFDSANKKPDFKQIFTTFFSHKNENAAPVPLWIIILSVLLGIVLTTLLTLLLVKLGFFNRKIKDDLDALKSTEEVNQETEISEQI